MEECHRDALQDTAGVCWAEWKSTYLAEDRQTTRKKPWRSKTCGSDVTSRSNQEGEACRCEREGSLLLIYLTIQCHAFSIRLTSSQQSSRSMRALSDSRKWTHSWMGRQGMTPPGPHQQIFCNSWGRTKKWG